MTDEAGKRVSADSIRLKDTLLAFELERNEPLNQIAEPPVSSLTNRYVASAQKQHQKASKAQAQAIIRSGKTYKSVKLNMPALTRARKLEEQARRGHLNLSAERCELDKLLSETEQMLFDAPGIQSELALHWFRSEMAQVCKELERIREKFKEMECTVS